MQEGLQQLGIEALQVLAQPVVTGKGLLDIKAIGLRGVQVQAKAQFDHQQRMLEQEATQLTGVAQAFAYTQQKGFEVGAFGMSRSPTRRVLSLPLLNSGPIQQGKEGAIVLDQGIMLEQSRHG